MIFEVHTEPGAWVEDAEIERNMNRYQTRFCPDCGSPMRCVVCGQDGNREGGAIYDASAEHIHEAGRVRQARVETSKGVSGQEGLENSETRVDATTGQGCEPASDATGGKVLPETDVSGLRLASQVGRKVCR